MKLGFESVVWGQRVDDLDHMLAVVKACGYEGVELAQSPRNIYVRESGSPMEIGRLDNLLKRFEKHGLELIGLVGGTLKERITYLGDYRGLYLYLDSWPDEAMGCLVHERPITLAVHPHWFMDISRWKQVRELFVRVEAECPDRSSYLKAILDTAHSIIAEDDPVTIVKEDMHRLCAVHVKDWKPDFGRWSHRYPKGFVIPGGEVGIVPIDRIMDTLHTGGYQGWIIMEQDHFEESRERTALTSARWAEQKGKQWSLPCLTHEARVAELETSRPKNPWRDTAGALGALEVTRAFASSPTTSAESFHRNAVTTLITLLKCEYAKLWTYNPKTKHFYLLAALNENKEPVLCRTDLALGKGLAGAVAATPTVAIHDLTDPEIRCQFSDTDFLATVKSRWMVCVPVFNAANAHHLRMMFSIFTDRDFRGGERLLELLAQVIALWADYVTGEICAAAAGATNYLCGNVKTGVTPFVDALHDHLVKAFDCENVTIFLKDASRTRLEPVGKCASRLKWPKDSKAGDRCYKKGEGLTGKVWEDKEMIFSPHAPNAPGHAGKAKELPEGQREEVLFAPLARLHGEVLGVIRLRNKRPRPGMAASTMFHDDDAAKLDSIIESALPYLELLLEQRRRAQSLVRLNHEMQNPLNGINGATDLLREKLKMLRGSFPEGISDLKAALGADYIEDILAYRELMSRLASNAKLFGDSFDQLKPEFDRIDLATQVVEPVARQLRPLVRSQHLPENRIHVAAFQGVIPWLFVDKLMMQQVFFNLLTNAIKYHDSRQDFRVEVEVRAVDKNSQSVEGRNAQAEWYWIDVVDWGIGLDDDPEAPERMLLPLVRGASAVKVKDPGGSGIGLSVVKDIIEKHGGTVGFVPSEGSADAVGGARMVNLYRKPTRFRISLPASLRHTKPRAN